MDYDHFLAQRGLRRHRHKLVIDIAVALAAALLFLAPPASAHDSWISRGGLRNQFGEHCCGVGDCAVMDPKSVGFTQAGYSVSGWGTIEGTRRREFYHELVPEHEAQPSPDGAYWRCKRPDGTRRCFFAPPLGS